MPINIYQEFIPITKDMNYFMEQISIKIWKSNGFKLYEQGDDSGCMYVANSNRDRTYYCPDSWERLE